MRFFQKRGGILDNNNLWQLVKIPNSSTTCLLCYVTICYVTSSTSATLRTTLHEGIKVGELVGRSYGGDRLTVVKVKFQMVHIKCACHYFVQVVRNKNHLPVRTCQLLRQPLKLLGNPRMKRFLSTSRT